MRQVVNFEVKRKVEAEKRKAAVEKAQEIEEANRMEYMGPVYKPQY